MKSLIISFLSVTLLTCSLAWSNSENAPEYKYVEVDPSQIITCNQGLFLEFQGDIWKIHRFEDSGECFYAIIKEQKCGIGELCKRCKEGYIICEECWGCSNPDCRGRCRCDDE